MWSVCRTRLCVSRYYRNVNVLVRERRREPRAAVASSELVLLILGRFSVEGEIVRFKARVWFCSSD